MNKTLTTTLTVLAIFALAGVIFFVGSMFARINAFGLSMMNGYGWNNSNTYNPNMMNGHGPSMMRNGSNMMGGYEYNNTNVTPLTVDQVKAAAEKYLANLNNSALKIAEIMIFDNNGYVIVQEASTGIGAFELLIDPASQTAYPEHGPNMMWNLKYSRLNHQYMMNGNGSMMGGMMGNMMSGWNDTVPTNVPAEMTITPEQAIEYAQKYLDANISGATAAAEPIQFYGYYSLDFEKDGKVVGMLSINGFSGHVFLPTWHGTFIEESEIQ